MAGSEQRKPWRKVLYANEDYPDNYTDASFLEELKKNVNERRVSLTTAIAGAALVSQQLCLIITFCLGYVLLHLAVVGPTAFLGTCCLLGACGYALYTPPLIKLPSHARSVIIFFALGYLLSPVLKTLTESVSTDTIYATTVFTMAVHLVFFDYGVKAFIVSSSLSINASVFGSLCLASRLATPYHAFVLLAWAVHCFVLCPVLLAKLGHPPLITVIIIIICTFMLYQFSPSLVLLFISAVVFINFICPYLFVRWHTYKDNIYGPWDEAVVTS
ncbi:hypothetical protein AAG570_011812 [Ranatra chinensis]|uniref:Phosphatidylinositol N-acetylglucosaminyltransferase subunit C n=1 Tax=Ranatra chinensis TaxID=642074 RepID=A0ABD0YH97_9HEMI